MPSAAITSARPVAPVFRKSPSKSFMPTFAGSQAVRFARCTSTLPPVSTMFASPRSVEIPPSICRATDWASRAREIASAGFPLAAEAFAASRRPSAIPISSFSRPASGRTRQRAISSPALVISRAAREAVFSLERKWLTPKTTPATTARKTRAHFQTLSFEM